VLDGFQGSIRINAFDRSRVCCSLHVKRLFFKCFRTERDDSGEKLNLQKTSTQNETGLNRTAGKTVCRQIVSTAKAEMSSRQVVVVRQDKNFQLENKPR
jgi:hypothetical protein